jgi:predicted transcriptional regulator
MKTNKAYYLAVNKQTGEAIISTTISAVANMLGICRQSVAKYLSTTNKYESDSYMLWRDMKITKCKRKFCGNKW